MGVRGTAGATPAPATRATTTSRRESFATPVPLRPGSSLAEFGAATNKENKLSTVDSATPTTASATIPALGKSMRVNGAALNSSSSTAPPSAMKGRFVDGSMGPPISTTGGNRPRSSLSGTLGMNAGAGATPAKVKRLSTVVASGAGTGGNLLARSSSARPSASIGTSTASNSKAAHRQGSSVSLRSSLSELSSSTTGVDVNVGEKENVPVVNKAKPAVTSKVSRRMSMIAATPS